jgi:hypothetical protein
MHLKWGTIREWGGERVGGQYTANLGSQWTGIRATTKEGFQVSKKGVQGIRTGISEQRGLPKGLGHAPPGIYYAKCVYVVLRKDCV